MIAVNPYEQHVATSLLDFFAWRTPWQRRLWAVGLVLGLREVLEACEAHQNSVLSERALKGLCHTVEVTAGHDPGVGSPEQCRLLQSTLRRAPKPGGVDFRLLKQILERIEAAYLKRWAQSIADETNRPGPERTARAISAHLLDSGFSATYLHRWWSYRIHHEPETKTLADILEDAHALVSTSGKSFEILVAFIAAPRSRADMPPEWRNAAAVSEWLKVNQYDPTGLRQGGGMLLEVTARDPWAAIDQVLEKVERLVARVAVGTRSRLQVHNQAWLRGRISLSPSIETDVASRFMPSTEKSNFILRQGGAISMLR